MAKTNQMFIIDTASGKIRPTSKAIDLYGKRFAEVGMDIRKMTTKQEFRVAADLIFEKQMREFARTDAGENPILRKLFAGLPGWEDPE